MSDQMTDDALQADHEPTRPRRDRRRRPTRPDGPPAQRRRALENEGDIAADYLEELLDIADLDGDLDMDVEGDRASVSIVGGDLSQLVGRDGEVLEALQELTRLAVYRETGERSRLMLDIGGTAPTSARGWRSWPRRPWPRSGLRRAAKALDPMTPFERKVVHDAVAAAGLRVESEGEEPTPSAWCSPVVTDRCRGFT